MTRILSTVMLGFALPHFRAVAASVRARGNRGREGYRKQRFEQRGDAYVHANLTAVKEDH